MIQQCDDYTNVLVLSELVQSKCFVEVSKWCVSTYQILRLKDRKIIAEQL